MHCIEHHVTGTRLLRPLAAAVVSAAVLTLTPAANAQMSQTPARPQTQSPQGQSPSPTISDQKLDAAAAAMGQVTDIRQNYEQKIAKAPPSDKQQITDEANTAMKKAVADQGLSVDEYNTILQTAQNDPAVRQRFAQHIRPSGQ